jgi:hypothetical protein
MMRIIIIIRASSLHSSPLLADESEEVTAVRGRVEELRRRVQQRNQSIKLLADELITLLDDLNMVDNWAVHTQK